MMSSENIISNETFNFGNVQLRDLNNLSLTVDNVTAPVTCTNDMPDLFIVTPFLYIIVCILGLLGNTLVIYVVLRFSKMRTVTNMYIVNLAIADEFFLIGLPFLIVTIYTQSWPFDDLLCKFYMASTSINQFTSSIFLTIMSADRYIAVCHPIYAPKIRTPFVSKIVSLMAWTVSFVLMLPVLLFSATRIDENNVRSCNIMWPDSSDGLSNSNSDQHAYIFTLYSAVLGFALPLTLIFIFYTLLVLKLRTVGPKNTRKSKETKRSHRKVTRLVFTVIAVYVFCWLPYWIMQIMLIFVPPKQCQSTFTVVIFLITGCLSYSNSAMNPILYAFLSENFKKSFLKACSCVLDKRMNASLRRRERTALPRIFKDYRNGGGIEVKITSRNNDGNDEMGEKGLLMGRIIENSLIVSSRSNITVSSEAKDNQESIRNEISENTNTSSSTRST